MSIKVSVIVPCYNVEQFLPRCLDSLVNQTLKDIEIICVNDASPDNSLAILRDYEARYDNIVVIDLKENVRQGGARNRGIEIARGEYIAFVDSDDWVDLQMYEKLYTKARQTQADMVGCDYDIVGSDLKTISRHITNKQAWCGTLSPTVKKQLFAFSGSIWSKLIKHSIFDDPEIRFPEHLCYEDNYLCPIIDTRITSFQHIPECLYHYFYNTDSISKKHNSPKIFDRLISLDKLHDYVKQHHLTNEYREELGYFTLRILFNTIVMYYNTFDHPERGFLQQIHHRIKTQVPTDIYHSQYYLTRMSKRERLHLSLFRLSPSTFYILKKWKQSLKRK